MAKYSEKYNPITEYYDLIKSGKIIVCEKVRQVYKKLVFDLTDKNCEYEYNAKKANRAIEFIEGFCKHSKGKWGGKPLVLELWQKALLAATFGMIHKIDGTRKYLEVLLIVARKNGKSVFASGVALYLMIADGEAGAEIYSAATKKEQAKIIWLEAKSMVRKSPALAKRIKCLVGEISCESNDSIFKPLCSESNTLDGLNVHGGMIDELHAISQINLYDVIKDGMSAREQPLLFITSTAGTIRENIFDLKYDEATTVINGFFDPDGYKDERFLPVIYELDKREEWITPEAWIKANPNLGVSKSVEQLQGKVNKAKANPLLVKNLLTKDFNIRETTTEAWLTFEQINNEEKFDISELKPSYGIGGADLSRTTDLTAACMLFKFPDNDKIYVESMYWLPEDLLEKRSQEDKIPYDKWYEQGLIRVSRGNSINPKDITEWFAELMNEKGIYLFNLGYDAWSAKLWVEDMKNNFGDVLTPVIQGKKTLSDPMRKLGAELEAKNINYNNNPITKWCLTNTSVDIDKNDNMQPCKTSNQRRRIDGMAAMLNAYVVLNDRKEDYNNIMQG